MLQNTESSASLQKKIYHRQSPVARVVVKPSHGMCFGFCNSNQLRIAKRFDRFADHTLKMRGIFDEKNGKYHSGDFDQEGWKIFVRFAETWGRPARAQKVGVV